MSNSDHLQLNLMDNATYLMETLNTLLACVLTLQSAIKVCMETQSALFRVCRKRKWSALGDHEYSASLIHLGTKKTCSRAAVHWHNVAGIRFSPQYWVFPRSEDWWENFVTCVWSDERWLLNFRMTRETFMEIVEALRPRMERRATIMRRAILVEKCVAVAIWYLATNVTYRDLQELFGIGISTICEIVIQFCHAVEADLFRKVVRLGEDVGTVSVPACYLWYGAACVLWDWGELVSMHRNHVVTIVQLNLSFKDHGRVRRVGFPTLHRGNRRYACAD